MSVPERSDLIVRAHAPGGEAVAQEQETELTEMAEDAAEGAPADKGEPAS